MCVEPANRPWAWMEQKIRRKPANSDFLSLFFLDAQHCSATSSPHGGLKPWTKSTVLFSQKFCHSSEKVTDNKVQNHRTLYRWDTKYKSKRWLHEKIKVPPSWLPITCHQWLVWVVCSPPDWMVFAFPGSPTASVQTLLSLSPTCSSNQSSGPNARHTSSLCLTESRPKIKLKIKLNNNNKAKVETSFLPPSILFQQPKASC